MRTPRQVPPEALTKNQAYRLVFRHKMLAAVRRWLLRLQVRVDDVDDVAHDVFLRAHRSFDSYDPTRARPERWLNRIAVHTAAHYNERAVHRREVLVAREGFHAADPSPNAQEVIACEQRRLLLLECLQEIDIRDSMILIAHDLDGVPMREVSEKLGVPVSTAYKGRARAREALREALLARLSADVDTEEEEDEEVMATSRSRWRAGYQ